MIVFTREPTDFKLIDPKHLSPRMNEEVSRKQKNKVEFYQTINQLNIEETVKTKRKPNLGLIPRGSKQRF